MKTFSEACESVLVRQVFAGESKTAVAKAIKEECQKYEEVYNEVLESELTEAACSGFLSLIPHMTLLEILAMTFARGVIVGCEMTRVDDFTGGIGE